MLKDRWTILLATAGVVFIGLCILLSGGVYTTVKFDSGSGFYRVNKFTGKTCWIRRDTIKEVEYELEIAFRKAESESERQNTPSKSAFDDLPEAAPKSKDK
jgi:hypothetical protein